MGFSIRERKIWIEMVVDLVVAVYYFTSVYQLSGWDEITGDEMGRIIRNSIAFAILGSIILNVAFIRSGKDEGKDERDYIIDARSNAFAYYTLFILCCMFIGHIMLVEGAEFFFSWQSEPLSNPFIMHLIALSLLASSFIKATVQIISYRRGY